MWIFVWKSITGFRRSLSLCSRVLLKKLTFPRLVKILPYFMEGTFHYRCRNSTPLFPILSQINFTHVIPFYLRYILISSSPLRLTLANSPYDYYFAYIPLIWSKLLPISVRKGRSFKSFSWKLLLRVVYSLYSAFAKKLRMRCFSCHTLPLKACLCVTEREGFLLRSVPLTLWRLTSTIVVVPHR